MHILLVGVSPDSLSLLHEPMGERFEGVLRYCVGLSMTKLFGFLFCCDIIGIELFIEGSTIDSHLFSPVEDEAYFTIHVTSEPECSFVGFETNVRYAHVIRVFVYMSTFMWWLNVVCLDSIYSIHGPIIAVENIPLRPGLFLTKAIFVQELVGLSLFFLGM